MPLASSRSSTDSKAASDRRRLSLPSTIDSSTRVTTRSRRAIDRRRASLQRSNSGDIKGNKRPLEAPSSPQNQERTADKENNAVASPGVTPYWKVAQERGGSPRLTRSATKSKRVKRPPIAVASNATKHGHEDYGAHGVLLNFSPPDHEANARREREENERKHQERALRIQQAKERGRLLVFSPSTHPTTHSRSTSLQLQPFDQHDDKNDNDGQKPSPSNSAASMKTSQSRSVAQSSSSLVEATLSEHHDHFVCELKSLRQGVDQLLATRDQAATIAVAAATEEERRRADQSMLEAQLARNEGLALSNLQLEDSNRLLQQRVGELQLATDQAKELLVIERSRLEAKVEAVKREFSVRIQGLEESRQQLESQAATLQQQKAVLVRHVSDLETELKVAHEKLDHTKTSLESVRSTNKLEKELLQREIQQLNKANAQLNHELLAAKEAQDELESKLSQYEEDIDNLQNQLLPESEDQLQEALSKLQDQTAETARAEEHLLGYQAEIKLLHQEVHTLRDGVEQERVNFQQLNEDSAVAFEKMNKQAAAKDEKIQELLERVEILQNDLDTERKSSHQSSKTFSKWKQEMERRSLQIDQALTETMSLLENAERKEKDASCKLEGALSRLELELQAKESALASSQRNEAVVTHLEEACLSLESEAREQSRRAKELERQLQTANKERDLARERVEHHDMREEELFRKLMENECLRRDLHNRVMQLSGNIRVFVRVRPPLAIELERQPQLLGSKPCSNNRRSSGVARGKSSIAAPSMVDQDEDGVSPFRFPGIYDHDDDSKMTSVACHGTDDILKNLVEVTEPYKDRGGLSDRRKKWRFGFDQVFTPQQGQDDVWKATEPLVQSAIDGFNVTIFAFGQTGSGKTYTLLGEPGNEGVISRSISKLFETRQDIVELSRGATNVEMSVELLEIYNEQVRDLLAPNSGPNGLEVALKITSNEVVGNERLPVHSKGQVSQILEMAQKRRCVKATLANAESSRSHMLFTIHFHVTNKEGMQRHGKLNICDLAGSERLSKSGANTFVGGELLKETQHINKSLSTLSNVIERLQEGSPNVPFRESKLTYLLQNSLGGNSKTLAIVCCNPLGSHFHESLCSLRFAAKVSKVDLKAVANFSC